MSSFWYNCAKFIAIWPHFDYLIYSYYYLKYATFPYSKDPQLTFGNVSDMKDPKKINI